MVTIARGPENPDGSLDGNVMTVQGPGDSDCPEEWSVGPVYLSGVPCTVPRPIAYLPGTFPSAIPNWEFDTKLDDSCNFTR